MATGNQERVRSFIEFEAEPPIRLTEESAGSFRARLVSELNFGGTSVTGVGWNIAQNLPAGLSAEELADAAERISRQIQCGNAAGSIVSRYPQAVQY